MHLFFNIFLKCQFEEKIIRTLVYNNNNNKIIISIII